MQNHENRSPGLPGLFLEETLYLLDTDTCIFVRRHKPESVLKESADLGFERDCLSVVTLYELTYGAEKHDHPIKARQQLRDFLRPFRIMEWTEEAAVECAKIRARLEKHGEVIGPCDVQIAAHARALGRTVATNHEREFRRVKGIGVENWGPARG